MPVLLGHVAVVTGAASGIGRAIALRFALEGAKVAIIDRNKRSLDELHRQIEEMGGVCASFPSDVTDDAVVEASAREIVQQWGAISSVVTAAAVSQHGNVLETGADDWERTMDVNAKGTFLWVRACLPSMLEAGRGSIITIASQLAHAGGRSHAIYVASKGAVISLTQAIALDFAELGIRANVLIPGAIQTPALDASHANRPDAAAARERARTRHPMKRFGRPEEVAATALFLASDESSFTTGSQIRVDGGYLVG